MFCFALTKDNKVIRVDNSSDIENSLKEIREFNLKYKNLLDLETNARKIYEYLTDNGTIFSNKYLAKFDANELAFYTNQLVSLLIGSNEITSVNFKDGALELTLSDDSSVSVELADVIDLVLSIAKANKLVSNLSREELEKSLSDKNKQDIVDIIPLRVSRDLGKYDELIKLIPKSLGGTFATERLSLMYKSPDSESLDDGGYKIGQSENPKIVTVRIPIRVPEGVSMWASIVDLVILSLKDLDNVNGLKDDLRWLRTTTQYSFSYTEQLMSILAKHDLFINIAFDKAAQLRKFKKSCNVVNSLINSIVNLDNGQPSELDYEKRVKNKLILEGEIPKNEFNKFVRDLILLNQTKYRGKFTDFISKLRELDSIGDLSISSLNEVMPMYYSLVNLLSDYYDENTLVIHAIDNSTGDELIEHALITTNLYPTKQLSNVYRVNSDKINPEYYEVFSTTDVNTSYTSNMFSDIARGRLQFLAVHTDDLFKIEMLRRKHELDENPDKPKYFTVRLKDTDPKSPAHGLTMEVQLTGEQFKGTVPEFYRDLPGFKFLVIAEGTINSVAVQPLDYSQLLNINSLSLVGKFNSGEKVKTVYVTTTTNIGTDETPVNSITQDTISGDSRTIRVNVDVLNKGIKEFNSGGTVYITKNIPVSKQMLGMRPSQVVSRDWLLTLAVTTQSKLIDNLSNKSAIVDTEVLLAEMMLIMTSRYSKTVISDNTSPDFVTKYNGKDYYYFYNSGIVASSINNAQSNQIKNILVSSYLVINNLLHNDTSSKNNTEDKIAGEVSAIKNAVKGNTLILVTYLNEANILLTVYITGKSIDGNQYQFFALDSPYIAVDDIDIINYVEREARLDREYRNAASYNLDTVGTRLSSLITMPEITITKTLDILQRSNLSNAFEKFISDINNHKLDITIQAHYSKFEDIGDLVNLMIDSLDEVVSSRIKNYIKYKFSHLYSQNNIYAVTEYVISNSSKGAVDNLIIEAISGLEESSYTADDFINDLLLLLEFGYEYTINADDVYNAYIGSKVSSFDSAFVSTDSDEITTSTVWRHLDKKYIDPIRRNLVQDLVNAVLFTKDEFGTYKEVSSSTISYNIANIFKAYADNVVNTLSSNHTGNLDDAISKIKSLYSRINPLTTLKNVLNTELLAETIDEVLALLHSENITAYRAVYNNLQVMKYFKGTVVDLAGEYIKFTDDGVALHDQFTPVNNWGDNQRSSDELTKSKRIDLFINSIPMFEGSTQTFDTQSFYRTQTEVFSILFNDVIKEDGATKAFNKNDLYRKPFETLKGIYEYLTLVYANPLGNKVGGYSFTPKSLRNNIKLVRLMLSILKPLKDITNNFSKDSNSTLFNEWLFTTHSVKSTMFTTNLHTSNVVLDLGSKKSTNRKISKLISKKVTSEAIYRKYKPTVHYNVKLDSPVIQFTIDGEPYVLGTTYAWNNGDKKSINRITVNSRGGLPDGTQLNIGKELSKEDNLFSKIFGISSDPKFINLFKNLFQLNDSEFHSVATALVNAGENLQSLVLQGIANAMVGNSYSNTADKNERDIINNKFITAYNGGNKTFSIFSQADGLINVLGIDNVDLFSSILLASKELALPQNLQVGTSSTPGNINPQSIKKIAEALELSEDKDIPKHMSHAVDAIKRGDIVITTESSVIGSKNLVIRYRNTNLREYLLHDLLVSIKTPDFWSRYKHYVFSDRHLQSYTAFSPDYTIYTPDSTDVKFYEASVNQLYDAASYTVLLDTLHTVKNSILLFSKYLAAIGNPIQEDVSKLTSTEEFLLVYEQIFEGLNGLTEDQLMRFVSDLPLHRHKDFLFVKGSHYTTGKGGVIKPNILLIEELKRFNTAGSILGYARWVHSQLEADAAKLIIQERASFDLLNSPSLINYIKENFPTDDVSLWTDSATGKIKLIKVFKRNPEIEWGNGYEEYPDIHWIGDENTIIKNMVSTKSSNTDSLYKFELNPIVTLFLARNYYAAETMRPLFIGGQAQALTNFDSDYDSSDVKAQRKAVRKSKIKSMATQVKRAQIATSTVLPPQVHLKKGLPLFQNVAIVADYKNPMLSITGRSADLDSSDGQSFVPYEMLIMQNVSYPGQTKGEGNSKTAYTVSIPGASSSMIIKHSLATISNSSALSMSGRHNGSLTADIWYKKIFDHTPYDDNGNVIKFTLDLADTLNAVINTFGKPILFTETEITTDNKPVEKLKRLVKVEYSESADDGNGGFIATYQNVTNDREGNILPIEEYTKELQINTNYDIRQKLLGGEKSVGIENGRLVYNEDTSYLMVDIMSNYNYTAEDGTVTEQPLKQSMIHMLSYGSAVKLSPVNTNTYNSFTDTDSKLATVRINSLHGGKILDTAYEYEEGEVNGVTQAINACVQGIYNHGDADAMFLALGELIEARINELFNYSDISQSRELTAELLLRLNNAFIKLLKDKIEIGVDSAQDLNGVSLLNSIIEHVKARGVQGLDTKLPIDNPNVFYAWFSALIKFVNEDAIKNTFPGAMYVLTAHWGINAVYDTPDGPKTREDMYQEYLISGGLKPHPDDVIKKLGLPTRLGLDSKKFSQNQFDELSLVKVGDTLVFLIKSDGVNGTKTVYAYVDADSSKDMTSQLRDAANNSSINISLADVVDFKYSGVNSQNYQLILLVYRDMGAGRALRGGEVEVEFKEPIQSANGITVNSIMDLDLPSIQCIQRVRLLRELFSSNRAVPKFDESNILTEILTSDLTESELYLVDNFMITVNLLRQFIGKYSSEENSGISIDLLTADEFTSRDSDGIEDLIRKISNTATPVMMGLMVGKSIDLNTIDCQGPSMVLPAQLLPEDISQTVVTRELTKPATIREVEVMMDTSNKNKFGIEPGMTIGHILDDSNSHFKKLVKNLQRPSELFSEYIVYQPSIDKLNLAVLTKSQLKSVPKTFINVYTPNVKEDPINVDKLVIVDRYGNPIIRYDSSYEYYTVAGNLVVVVPNSTLNSQEKLDDCISSMDQGVKHSSLGENLNAVAETVFLNNEVSYNMSFAEAISHNEHLMVQRLRSSFELMLTNVGVRIPSQTLASSTVIKIISFTNARTNQVRVPLTLTWYQGADYDIDKMTVVGVPISKRGLVEAYTPLFDYSDVDRLKLSIQLPVPNNRTYTEVHDNVLFVNDEATDLYALPSYYNLLVNSKEKLLTLIKNDYNAFYALVQLINEVYTGNNIHFKDGTPQQLLVLSDVIKEHSDFRLSRRAKHQALKTAIFGKLMWINSSAANKVYATSSVEVDELNEYLQNKSNKASVKLTDMRLLSHLLLAFLNVSQGAEGIGVAAVAMKTSSVIALVLNKQLSRVLIDLDKNPLLDKALLILEVDGSPSGVNLDRMSRLVSINSNTDEDVSSNRTNKPISPVGIALKAYFNSHGNDIFSDAGAYMTMAVDNVKEAMLYMLNASKDLLGTIMAASTLNVTFEKIVDIMNSKAVDGALRLALKSQLFENYHVPISDLYEFVVGIPKLNSVGLGSLRNMLGNYFNGVAINDKNSLISLYNRLSSALKRGGIRLVRDEAKKNIADRYKSQEEIAQAMEDSIIMAEEQALEMMEDQYNQISYKPTKLGRDILTYVELLIQRAAFLEGIFDGDILTKVKNQKFNGFYTTLEDIEIAEGETISEDIGGLRELFVFQQLYKFGQSFTFLAQHSSLNGGLKGTQEDMTNFVDGLNRGLRKTSDKSVYETEDLISLIDLRNKSTYQEFDDTLDLPVYKIMAEHNQYNRMFSLFLGVLNTMNSNSLRVNVVNKLKSKWGNVFSNSPRAITITNDIISNSMITAFLATLNISFKNSSGVKINSLNNIPNIQQFIDLFQDKIYPSVELRDDLADNEFFRNITREKYQSDLGTKLTRFISDIDLSQSAKSGVGKQLLIKTDYNRVKNQEITDDIAVYLDGKKLTFGETLELYSLLLDKAKYAKNALTTLFEDSVGKQFSIQSRYMQFMTTNSISPESLVSNNDVRDWEDLTSFEQNFLILNAVESPIDGITTRKSYGYVQKVSNYRHGTVLYYYNQRPIVGLLNNLLKLPVDVSTSISSNNFSSHAKQLLIKALEDSLTSNRISFKIVEC